MSGHWRICIPSCLTRDQCWKQPSLFMSSTTEMLESLPDGLSLNQYWTNEYLIVHYPPNSSVSFLSFSSFCSYFILSLPVSRIAEVPNLSLPPAPTTAFPLTSLGSWRKQKHPVRSSHPWFQSSGGRLAALGSASTFCNPPNQVQSHPVSPIFSSSSSFFFKTL